MPSLTVKTAMKTTCRTSTITRNPRAPSQPGSADPKCVSSSAENSPDSYVTIATIRRPTSMKTVSTRCASTTSSRSRSTSPTCQTSSQLLLSGSLKNLPLCSQCSVKLLVRLHSRSTLATMKSTKTFSSVCVTSPLKTSSVT